MKTHRWILQETDANLSLMSEVLGISQVTANVMANRGLRSKKTAINFLAPTLDGMHDISTMKDAENAISLIAASIKNGSKIVVYGDYDVDGIMSTVILYKALTLAGADADFYIPHRIDEGYGLNAEAVTKLYEDGANVLLTVDNGISAIDEIAHANNLGMTVIVIDHHEPGFKETDDGREDILPPAAAIVDPKQSACQYPFKELCAAGLAYKLAAALNHSQGCGSDNNWQDELIALAAIATICDIVSLHDENRIIVKEGLARLNDHKLINPGLGSLITQRGYLDKQIDAFTIGFVLGPCLNATGRLGSANQSVELLLSEDIKERVRLANELCELNDARKQLTADCVARAMKSLAEPLEKVLVLTDLEAHESVAGIVAGRIKESTGRPTILITQGDGAMKGSGRSVEGYNLFEALYAHRHLFARFGGHPMAAGLTLPMENIQPLAVALNAECSLEAEDFIKALYIDRELSIQEVKLSLSDELARLAPFGKGNREPLFLSRRMYVESCRVMNEKNTLIFSFDTGARRVKGVAFGINERYAEDTAYAGVKPQGGFFMDVVYLVETNVYNGVSSVQVRVRDYEIVP